MSRTVIIGDVHGCVSELGMLLELVAPTGDDRVYFVGDLVARGPDTRGVLGLVREVRGRAVRGNHEQRLLDVRQARLGGEQGPRLGPQHERVLAELADDDWTLLESLPLYRELPDHGARVVHAGVAPGVAMNDQDTWALLHMRSLDGEGRPTDRQGEQSWAASYHDGPHVVFGHNARRQLQLWPRATGLDTGCVYGGSLTALVLGRGQPVPFPNDRRELLVSVKARAAYAPRQ